MSIKSQSLNRLNLEGLYNTFLGLTPREQTFTLVGFAVAVILLLGLPVSLAVGKLSTLEKAIQQSRENRRQVIREIESYKKMDSQFNAVAKQFEKGFDRTITTTMEKLAQQVGIKDRIESLKERPIAPSDLYDELAVDVRISKVTLDQLADFLYRIEQHEQLILRIKQLQVKPRYGNRNLLDASFQVATYRLQ